MAPEPISIATCINAIFSNLSGDQRDTIRGKLENEFIFLQEDLKNYTVDDLHDKVKVPLNAAKTLESSGLLKDPAAPTGGALPDMTADLLETLIQPFDHIPGSLDVVELQNLLTTDLRIKIPCFSNVLASSFSDCLQHSTIEKCPRLESVLALFLNGPRRPMASSEYALVSLWDRLFVDLPQLIHEVLHFPISTNRNVVDESLSTFYDTRDYLLYLQTLPVVFGEEKRHDNEMSEAYEDLLKKRKGIPGKHIYGRLDYVMCYAAAGQSRFQLFAVPVGIAYPNELIALTGMIDPSLRMGRVKLLKTFVNVIRWINTVHRQELIGGLSLHNFYEAFKRPSPYDDLGEVEITLFGNHVKKLFKVPTKHLHTLLDVYRVLCSGNIGCSIQLESMTVDGRQHLPVSKEDSEETESDLSYAVVELKLKPIARVLKPKDEADFKFLVFCILKAIVDLHEHGICHRDVRMANILRAPSEWILIDFELAGRAGDRVFWNSRSLMRGSPYRKDQDLNQLAGVIEALSSIAGPSLLQFAGELKRMESAAQALAHFVEQS